MGAKEPPGWEGQIKNKVRTAGFAACVTNLHIWVPACPGQLNVATRHAQCNRIERTPAAAFVAAAMQKAGSLLAAAAS